MIYGIIIGWNMTKYCNAFISQTIPNVNKWYFCGDQCPDQTSLVGLLIKSAINKY